MVANMKTSVLFTGYAPVHFLCFRPVYERLRGLAGVEVFFSGGLRTVTDTGFEYDGAALYRQFNIPADHILAVEDLGQRYFDVLFSANKRIITSAGNIGMKIQIFHGVSFRNRGVRPENLAYDFLFLIGPYMRRKFIETGILQPDDPRAVPIGFPKTDRLVNGGLEREALLARYELDGSRPILLYAPTGEAYNSLETMGLEVIAALARSNRYDLLVKPHDHPKNSGIDWVSQLAPFEDSHTRVVRNLDIIPLLYLADLLITDASSVANEFALLNRPIVFLDVPLLFQRSREMGANLDLETWGRRGGVVVERPEDVCGAIMQSLAEPERHAPVQEALAQDIFYHPGHATDTAVAWFTETFANA